MAVLQVRRCACGLRVEAAGVVCLQKVFLRNFALAQAEEAKASAKCWQEMIPVMDKAAATYKKGEKAARSPGGEASSSSSPEEERQEGGAGTGGEPSAQ